jgi:maltooligosyltrehalose trehalohydrolase
MAQWQLTHGATVQPDGSVRFSVWAPRARSVAVQGLIPDRTIPLHRNERGVYTTTVPDLAPGTSYNYLLDNERVRPDPVSRWQPQGVHGPSAIVNPDAFRWTDHAWKGVLLPDLILYELHVGTFTPAGTFFALIDYLGYLKDELGVTAIELMPVAEFPGSRNWGYDGVALYAPHSAYGGPEGLRTLVDACHAAGLGVALDVVYNHFGPEGNYLPEFGPYLTDRYQTPWGQAVNFDGPESEEVRRYIVENALYWVTEYHIDILRLDAIHGICDASPVHIVQEVAAAVHGQAEALGRTVLVIAESDLNDNRVITEVQHGGWGLNAQWSDDFHHALHTVLTGERHGYYKDFGQRADLVTALREGFVYQGQQSAFRGRSHGTPSGHLPAERFVIFSQNHDQIGNRPQGERLSALVSLSALKVAAGVVLCARNTPLLFMGEEYGETAPFLYFTSHTDPHLAQAVSEGRQREFAEAAWGPAVPDPQAVETFRRSLLRHHLREHEPHRGILRFYRDLIALRLWHHGSDAQCEVLTLAADRLLLLRRWQPHDEELFCLASLVTEPVSCTLPVPAGQWRQRLNSEAARYGGSGQLTLPPTLVNNDSLILTCPPLVFVVYQRIKDGEQYTPHADGSET